MKQEHDFRAATTAQPLEQKIKDRIAFLENRPLQTADFFLNQLDARIIDELRKLLSPS